MRNRREFLKTVAGAAAGAYVAGRQLPALAQRGGGGGRGGAAAAPTGPVKRKEISIGGKRVTVIDVIRHSPRSASSTPSLAARATSPRPSPRIPVLQSAQRKTWTKSRSPDGWSRA